MSWTDDRVEKLKKMWEGGMTASRIAAELGNVSRNGVIGKVHRLGLSGRVRCSTAQSSPTSPKATRSRQFKATVSREVKALTTIEAEGDHLDQSSEDACSTGKPCNLVDLTAATCRWPIGDPRDAAFKFCGGKALNGLAYCAHHTRIAYAPAHERRRPREAEASVPSHRVRTRWS